eukprot:c10323_g1_i2.p1 GENE.c10323_g1_i2~~c10323_g1_i2.p1  ORF type:complete len:254 (-),score=60.08 c10323_g1_i2:88-849(-)
MNIFRRRTSGSQQPVISFNVVIYNDKGKPKQRTLSLGSTGLSCLKGSSEVVWTAPSGNVLSVQPIESKGSDGTSQFRFCINVINKYDVEVTSAGELKRVLDAFKQLKIGEVQDVMTRTRSASASVVDTSLTISDFDVIDCIGRGNFGKVFRVSRRNDGREYAMKVLQVTDASMREGRVLAMLHHPFLVSLHHVFTATGLSVTAACPNTPRTTLSPRTPRGDAAMVPQQQPQSLINIHQPPTTNHHRNSTSQSS